MTPAILVRELRKSYGAKAAVDGVDLEVPRGSFFGFLGPNGAGKTTTIRMLTGLVPTDSGSIEILGYREWRAPQGQFSGIKTLCKQRSFTAEQDMSGDVYGL